MYSVNLPAPILDLLARRGCVLVSPAAFVPWVAACPECAAQVRALMLPAPVGSGEWAYCGCCGSCNYIGAARWRPEPAAAGQLSLF